MRRVVLVLFTFGVLASSLPASAQSGSTSVRHRDPAGDVRTHESNAYFQRGIDDHDIHEVTATWNPDGSVDASMTVANFTSPAAIAYGETATNWWGLVPTTRLHLRSLKSLDDDRWPAVEASVLFGGVDRRSVRMWPQTSGCDPTWSFSGDTFSIHLPGACVEGVDTLWATGHTSGRYGTIGGSFEMTDLAEAGPIVRRAGQTPTERNSHLPPGFGEGEPEPRWQADNDSRSEKAAFVDPDDDVEIDREQSQESQQRSGFLDVRQVTVTQVDGVPTVTVTGEPGFLERPTTTSRGGRPQKAWSW